MRQLGSTLALPRDGAGSLGKDESIPWHFAAEVMDYARVMKGSEDYMLEQLDRDIIFIETQEKEDEVMFGADNVEWSRKAVRSIKEAKERIKGIGNPPEMPTKPVQSQPRRAPIHFYDPGAAPDMYNIAHASSSGQSLSERSASEFSASVSTEPSTASHPTPRATRNYETTASDAQQPATSALAASLAQFRHSRSHAASQQPAEYFFYQALLHYYLSPLDVRILRDAFGSYSSFPSTILPRVEHVSTGHIIDDDFRKRTKYLAHLPFGCEVGFLECDWTDTVPAEVLEKFEPEIEKRRSRHLDKSTREEKARLLAEKEEERRYAFARKKRTADPSSSERFSANDFLPLQSSLPENGSTAASFDAGTTPPWAARQGSAFASLASPGTSPQHSRTVWGTPAIQATSPSLVAEPDHYHSAAAQPDDGWLQGWEKELLQEDEMLAQAQALSLAGDGRGESSKASGASTPVGGSGGSGGKKGKKKKTITLMSTNARRGAF